MSTKIVPSAGWRRGVEHEFKPGLLVEVKGSSSCPHLAVFVFFFLTRICRNVTQERWFSWSASSGCCCRRCAADGPPSSWLRAPVGRPLRRDARLPENEGGAGLPSQTCSISQSSRRRGNLQRFQGPTAAADSGRSERQQPEQDARERRRENGVVPEQRRQCRRELLSFSVFVEVSEALCRSASTGTCLSGVSAAGEVISELRFPGGEAQSGRPITAGPLHLLGVRTNQRQALVHRRGHV